MEVGIHHISNEEYHACKRTVSHSGLTLFEVAPRVYESWILKGNKPKETEAKKFGKLFHEALLEPHIFKQKYFADTPVYLECPNRTKKAYKDGIKILIEENPGKTLIKHDEWENIQGMLSAVKTALTVNAFKLGLPEQTLVWDDPDTGVRCRARPDFLREDGIILDVKTTECAHVDIFPYSDEKYKYYRQGAHYLTGATILKDRPYKKFVNLAIEKKNPWLWNMFETPEQKIWEGKRQLKKLLTQFKDCRDKNHWPGYPTEGQVTILQSTNKFIREVTEELEEEQNEQFADAN